MPSEVGFSVVICGYRPISRSALPGFGPRANLRALPSEATQAFTGQQHHVIQRLFDGPYDPGLDRRRVRRVVDGEHRTLQHVGALFGEQAGKLRFLARFQDQDAVAVQSVSHDLSSADRPYFVHPDAGFGIGARMLSVIEQGRKSLLR